MTTRFYLSKILIIYFLSIQLNQYSYSQTNKIFLTGNVEKDIKLILDKKEVIADIDSLIVDSTTFRLLVKFESAFKANSELFLEYSQNQKPGDGLLYDKRMGITDEEFIKLGEGVKKIRLISSHKEKIEFILNDNNITFKSKGRLKIFNGIKINLNEYFVTFDDYDTLTYVGLVDITKSDNVFQSNWTGHKWQLSEKSNLELKDDFNSRNYSVIIGIIEKTKKKFIKIKAIEIEKNKQTINYELVIEF